MVELGILLYMNHKDAKVIYVNGEKLVEKVVAYSKDEYELITLFFYQKKIELI